MADDQPHRARSEPLQARDVEPRDPPAAGPPSAAPAASADSVAAWTALLAPEQREALGELAKNLARASAVAQGALAAAAPTQADAATPDPFKVQPVLSAVAGRLAEQPDALVKAQSELFERYLDLWNTASRRAQGEAAPAVIAAPKGDKRWKDPEWSDNPVFDVIRQSYLITSDFLNNLASTIDGVDAMEKRRVEFFTRMLTDAFSPSNYLFTNPAALREAAATRGESLVRGAENFASDLARGRGQLAISQTDYERFRVGENVATAPGKVVFRNELFELLQFSPTTEQVFEIPLLIFPPWINKFYILDLKPENSMIRWLVGQGFTVFVTSWVNPGPELAGRTMTDYMKDGVYTALAQVLTQTGASAANTVGYCIGGTLLACTLAHMAARQVGGIASATFFAAQQDFAEAGDLLLFTSDQWMGELEKRMDAAQGVLPGQAMADTFNSLRANDLIWSFFVNNYLMGREPAAFDLLFWNSDQTRMPKALHMSYLDDFYRANRFSKGELTLDGTPLDASAVTIPIYVQSSREDHIAPMRSVYRGARLFGGPVTFTLAGSGHIAGVINAPAANKYQHWTNADLPPTVEAWLEGAEEHKGSWWPHWAAWLRERSGGEVPARDPAAGPLPVIEDAPGSYVKVRSDAAQPAPAA